MAGALSARPPSRKIPNLFSFFYFVLVLIEDSQFSTRAPVQGRKLSKLCGFACECSWMGSFSTVASQRWHRFLCTGKGILPESIVRRVPITRQLVVWLTETAWAGNPQSSLFLEEKLSSPETWIHWKPRLNKAALRARRMTGPKPMSVVCPGFVFEILNSSMNRGCFFLRSGTGLNQLTFKPVDVSVLI